MSSSADRGLPAEPEYLAAVEARLAELSRAPLVLSTRDWERVRRWRQKGIPLEVVLRALADVLGRPPADDQGGAARRPYSLAYCERAVEQRWRAHREGSIGRLPPRPPAPARVRSVLHALAREAQAAAARATRSGGAWRAFARPLRDLAKALREAARRVAPDGDPIEQVSASLVEAETALRSGLRSAAGGAWDRLRAEERLRLSPGLGRMTEDAASATAEASALSRLRANLGVPAFDPGALHARLHRPGPRRRLTTPPQAPSSDSG